jgi:hypothetical protein
MRRVCEAVLSLIQWKQKQESSKAPVQGKLS